MILQLIVFFLAIGQLGSAGAAEDYAAGVAAAETGDYERALAVWLPLAEAGHAASQFNVGMMHARGDGVAKDYAEAARWFRMAAEQSQVQAQGHLGGMYARGIGVERDYREAARWLDAAATQHHKESQYELGALYANGQGVEQDYGAAYFWFTLAGLQRYIPALAAKDEIRPYLHPAQITMVEQRAEEWLQENPPAPGDGTKTP